MKFKVIWQSQFTFKEINPIIRCQCFFMVFKDEQRHRKIAG